MVMLTRAVVERVYLGTTTQTQVIVELAAGVRLVALEQNTYRARSDDRLEIGMTTRFGWRPEHGLVLREGERDRPRGVRLCSTPGRGGRGRAPSRPRSRR